MAIGNPITLTSNVASKTINVIATASQSLFTVNGGYRINEIAVFRNGVRLVDGRDFTARDGSTVTLLSAASEGDAVEFQVFDTFRVADAITPFDSDQTIAGNLNITGILSASQLGSVNFNVTSGIQTFNDVRVGGALTVAGALTFEDVTNIDSVGIITAQSHVSIADSILHTGDTDTAIRFPAADTFTIETGGTEAFRVASDQKVYFGDFASAGSKAYIEKEVSGDYKLNIHASSSTSQNRIITFNSREDVEALRIDASGNVGIGTVDPSTDLHVATYGGHGKIRVESAGNGNRSGIEFYRESSAGTGKGGAGIWVESETGNSSGELRFGTASNAGLQSLSTKMILDSSGHLGVNTASPDRALHVFSTNGTVAHFESGNANEISQIVFEGLGASAPPILGAIGEHLHFTTNNLERVRIHQNGNVGIASDNPQKALDVGGDVKIVENSPRLEFHDANSSGLSNVTGGFETFDRSGNRATYVGAGMGNGGNIIEFGTNNTFRAIIDSSGNVGINSNSPGNKLSVDGDIGLYGSGTNHRNLYIYKDNVSTAWFKYRGDTNSVIIGTNAGDKLTINPNGGLNVAGITTATQLFEGTTRVATTGKAIAMAMLFG